MTRINQFFNRTLCTIFSALLFSLSVFAQSAKNGDNWYPASISLPANHRYPCNLTPLPRDLTGIPQDEKLYVNHSFSLLLRLLQAKIVMFDTVMWEKQAYNNAYNTYYANTVAARQKFMQIPVPKGLEGFRNDVVNAVDKQIVFFRAAASARQSGKTSREVLQIPQAKEASSLLVSAWGKVQTRYPGMSAAVKDSMYHHLCALDVF